MSTASLQAEYDHVRQLGRAQLLAGEIEILGPDPLKNDLRRGLGLFFWQNSIRDATLPYLDELRRLYPESIVPYGPADSAARQHITFLELVAGDRYREMSEMQVQEFTAVCDRALANMPPVRASFRGFLATGSAVIAQGFPEDDSFNAFRDALRDEIARAGLPPLARRKVTLFHSTVCRYVSDLGDITPLLNFVEKHRETRLGVDTFSELWLSTSSWLMAAQQTQSVKLYRLG